MTRREGVATGRALVATPSGIGEVETMVNGLWLLGLVVLGALWLVHMIRTAPMQPGEYSAHDMRDGLPRRSEQDNDEEEAA